jgi:hypothetical protein
MPWPKHGSRSVEDEQKFAFNKARRAQFAADAPVAMAEYRKANDDALGRMALLRAARLTRDAGQEEMAVKKRSKLPRPDQLPGPIKYKKPTGKKEDRPLEKLHQQSIAKRSAKKR